jgi:CIC family chloride channel protein
LLLLVLLKILATSLTVGSGSSGGVFTPLIFIGAVFGGFCFNILNQINPDINISSYIFITAGIAGIISSTIGAFITSIVVVFELFGNTHYILPIILVSAIAFATRYIFRTFSIYTMTLKEKGLIVPEGLQAAILPAVNVTEIMDTSFKIININEISEIIIDIKKEDSPDYIIVTDNENSFKGIINNSEISDGNEPKDIIDSNICLFSDRTNITELVSIFRERNLKYALIYSGIKNNDNCDITGIISLKEITELSKKEYFWLN